MIKRMMRFWSEEASLSVFLSILVVEMFVMGPMIRVGFLLGVVSDLLFSLLLVAGVFTVVQHRVLRWHCGRSRGAGHRRPLGRHRFRHCGTSFSGTAVLSLLASLAFLLIVLWQVYREGPVTGHRVRGAIAGYLLVAVCFSFAYGLIEFSHPGSFTFSAPETRIQPLQLDAFLYFSVITLTTVGFGDVLALHPFARSLVMLEAFIGALYPAILIARLVSLQTETRGGQRGRKDGEG